MYYIVSVNYVIEVFLVCIGLLYELLWLLLSSVLICFDVESLDLVWISSCSSSKYIRGLKGCGDI